MRIKWHIGAVIEGNERVSMKTDKEMTFFDSGEETGALRVKVNGQNMTVERFRKIRGALKIKRFDYGKEKKRPG